MKIQPRDCLTTLVALLLSLVTLGCRRFTPEEMEARETRYFTSLDRHPPRDMKRHLAVGMTRSEVEGVYRKPPAFSQVRPPGGWPTNEYGRESVFRNVILYQRVHGVQVHRCDVFESFTSFMQLNPNLDFMFFDVDERLIGYHRCYGLD